MAGVLRILLRVVPGLGLLTWLLVRFDILSGGFRVDSRALRGVAVGIGIILVAQLVSSVRWRLILNDHGMGVGYLFRLYLIGGFFGLALPTQVGGDGVKVLALSRDGMSLVHASASVLWDRISGLIALVAFGLLGALLVPEARLVLADLTAPVVRAGSDPAAPWVLLLLCVLLGGLAFGLRSMAGEQESPRRRTLARSLAFAASWRRTLPTVLGLAVVVQALNIAVWFVLGRSIGLELGWGYLAFAVPIVTLASLIPVSVSGLGVREGAWVLLLTPLGVAPSHAIGMSLLFFAVNLGLGCVGGALFLGGGLHGSPRMSPEGA